MNTQLEAYPIVYIKRKSYPNALVSKLNKMTTSWKNQEQRCPSITSDIILFHHYKGKLCVLMGYWKKEVLINNKKQTHEGITIVPGGHYERMGKRNPKITKEHGDKDQFHSAIKELQEETGIKNIKKLTPICIIDRSDNDPRTHVVRMVFCGYTKEMPKSTEEIQDFYHIPVQDLNKIIKENKVVYNGKTMKFALNHNVMLDIVSKLPAFKQYIKQIR